MKNRILFIILALTSLTLKAQVTETNEGGDIQQTINTLFQNVDVSQANTGFLLNKAVYFANIHDYDGTRLTNSTNVNINTLGRLYAMIHMAKVGTQTLPTPEFLYDENTYMGGVMHQHH
jgi:hypothetical protein